MNRMRLIKIASVFILAIVSTFIIRAAYAHETLVSIPNAIVIESESEVEQASGLTPALNHHANGQLEANVTLGFVNGDIFNDLVLTNNSNETLFYLNEFIVETYIDGTWYFLPQPEGLIFSDYGMFVIPGSTSVISPRVVDAFNLTSGTYRVVMNVTIYDEGRSQLTDQTHDLAVDFTIN